MNKETSFRNWMIRGIREHLSFLGTTSAWTTSELWRCYVSVHKLANQSVPDEMINLKIEVIGEEYFDSGR